MKSSFYLGLLVLSVAVLSYKGFTQDLRISCAYELASENHARNILNTLKTQNNNPYLISVTEDVVKIMQENRAVACTRMYEWKAN